MPIVDALAKFKPVFLHGDAEHNRADVRAFVADRLGRMRSDPGVLAAAVDALADKAAGVFIYAYLAVLQLQESGGVVTLGVIECMPDGLGEFYAERIERALDDRVGELEKDPVWRILQLVCAAKSPIPVDALPALLGEDATRDGRRRVKEAVAALSAVLLTHHGVLQASHKSVVDHLVDESRELERLYVDLRDVHRALGGGAPRSGVGRGRRRRRGGAGSAGRGGAPRRGGAGRGGGGARRVRAPPCRDAPLRGRGRRVRAWPGTRHRL